MYIRMQDMIFGTEISTFQSDGSGAPSTSTGGRQQAVMRVRAHSRSQRAVTEGDSTCEARSGTFTKRLISTSPTTLVFP